MNRPYGGFPSIRRNELRDITASLLTEVCHAVGTEPCLYRLYQEARLDVAENSWSKNRQKAFFDVKKEQPYSLTLFWLRCRLSFCVLQ